MSQNKAKIEQDMRQAQLISEGDEPACKSFVEKHSKNVLYKVRKFVKDYCHYPAQEYICCLIFLQQFKNINYSEDNRIQCDECIDSYIWIFDYLKKKAGSFKGKRDKSSEGNNCSLSTYIWVVLNSKNMYMRVAEVEIRQN